MELKKPLNDRRWSNRSANIACNNTLTVKAYHCPQRSWSRSTYRIRTRSRYQSRKRFHLLTSQLVLWSATSNWYSRWRIGMRWASAQALALQAVLVRLNQAKFKDSWNAATVSGLNEQHGLCNLVAGRKRWKGVRLQFVVLVMNWTFHGGGEGTPVGRSAIHSLG